MKRFAFFDVDDTLISVKSMFDFYRFWTLDWRDDPASLEMFETDFAELRTNGASREVLNRAYYRYFTAVDPEELSKAAQTWAAARLDKPERFFLAEPVAELRELKANDIEPVFVSGSFKAVLDPIANYLGVDWILATKMKRGANGCFTGKIGVPQTIGVGKAEAIRTFLTSQAADAANCLAFGDDISDLPMLLSVGTPVVVGSHAELAAHANAGRWRRLQALPIQLETNAT
ncbi:HAD family phosphatase [Ruegeria sp. EL01]|uniref:HAD family hydrolase n=1 Tax=Ruegeria sp. EL01 TaxID=2107578 RepID=UPI000EA82648|nr:HAD-IB family hydrolase [Ruegeria sp. EL01]